jgi:putative nucleotidyltransferase with HDIG domain
MIENKEKRVVASGTFFVGRQQALILQAFLGSCVGVAIYDAANGVGGMIHLLLPEQPVTGSSFYPEKYAATGLPLFLKALYDAGAVRKNLKATYAGGALIGPVSRQDLDLDIGGRTADWVRRILKEEGIPVVESESGGFFTCELKLDMQTWKCLIRPIEIERMAAAQPAGAIDLTGIAQAVERIQPIPQVALKILRMLDEGNYYITQIADEIRNDQVICARTIQLCNSALFSKKRQIETLEHALIYLGPEVLAQSVISSYVKEFFTDSAHGYSLCMGGIYHHAVGTAKIAEQLSRLTDTVSPALAYTGGLLHDIGKVILDQYIAAGFPHFYRAVYKETDFLKSEKLHLGIDHTTIGSQLAERWSFPESLQDVVANHHHPEKALHAPELTHLVYLADLLMSRFLTGLELERLNTDQLDGRLARIGLSVSRFHEIVDIIPREVLEALGEPSSEAS